jgi:hypothetical protein
MVLKIFNNLKFYFLKDYTRMIGLFFCFGMKVNKLTEGIVMWLTGNRCKGMMEGRNGVFYHLASRLAMKISN